MPSQREHHNNFNLIRLVAALQVLLVHAFNHFEYKAWFVDAFKVVPGVPTFYFISGFLIYASYERIHLRGLRDFFVNRMLRIYPALIVCVGLSVLSVWFTGYFTGRAIGVLRMASWIGAQCTFFQFYNPPFMRGYGVGVLNGSLWTISIELTFYLLMPVIFYLNRNRPKLLGALFLVSLTVNIGINWVLLDARNWDRMEVKLLYVSFAPWIWMFLTGVYAASTSAMRTWSEKISLKYLIPAFLLSMNLIGSYSSNASNAINPISFGILAIIILKVAYWSRRQPSRIMAFIERNDFSYGLYLYHLPLLNLLLVLGWFPRQANIPILIGTGALAAALSWFLIEKPALSHKR